MRFEIFRNPSHHGFFFRIVARNGQIIAQSEGYTTKQSAQKTIKSIMRQLEGARIKDLT
jgi:uncharacterized protein YegP (UPF0339 family)